MRFFSVMAVGTLLSLVGAVMIMRDRFIGVPLMIVGACMLTSNLDTDKKG